METTYLSWPILIVSAQFNAQNDEGFRLRELEKELKEKHSFNVIPSFTYEDAYEIFRSRSDFGCIVVDWDIEQEQKEEKMPPGELLRMMRHRHKTIPILLLTQRLETGEISESVLENINGCLWKTSDTIAFLAGRIKRHLLDYVQKVYPPFFGELVKYANEYKYAWHTPGHMGGVGFLRSPAGAAMFKFYGENVFRSDLSISVPELGSLLDHSGVAGDAEKNSARVFGADHTYYVLNGTSTANQIIWRSQVIRDDIAFVDRNCHKSLNYAMVITEAFPIYMIPRRNRRGIIGPVRLSEFSALSIRKKIQENKIIPKSRKSSKVKMSALTNSTYDGLCYNVTRIKNTLKKGVENLHFDEAWYAYAHFHPIYKNHYGMSISRTKEKHPPVFCSQSTHKLLTAFSQASMIHIKNGTKTEINPDEFNESYMMHGSTSPQYNIIASLDVATRMMDDNGKVMMDDIIKEAIRLRKNMAAISRKLKKEKKGWFFGMWQPTKIKVKSNWKNFEDVDTNWLAGHQEAWILSKDNNWHGFDDIEDNYVMLDPIKLTFTTPGIDEKGKMQEKGIPAVVVSNYLIDKGIVCEKTDYYSFLLLNSLGTTEAKQETLLSALLNFKQLYDKNVLLEEIFPEMVKAYPQEYSGIGLKDHCQAIHDYFKRHAVLEKMQKAFEVIPDQAMKPSDAYREIICKNVEYVKLDDMIGRIPAVMIVPYPPGIPIMMGGEVMNKKAKPIFDYLKFRQDFENKFPGYESDIHGVERTERSEKKYFKTLCLKK